MGAAGIVQSHMLEKAYEQLFKGDSGEGSERRRALQREPLSSQRTSRGL